MEKSNHLKLSVCRWLMLLMFAMLTSLGVGAHDFEVDGIFYEIIDATQHEVAVTNNNDTYNTYSGYVVIPPTVTYNGITYHVTEIKGYAFYGNGVTGVTIPNTVRQINGNAFTFCPDMTRIVIPNSVKKIGECAFMECFLLSDIYIGSGVEAIGDYAFGFSSVEYYDNYDDRPTQSVKCFAPICPEFVESIYGQPRGYNPEESFHFFLTRGELYVPSSALNAYSSAIGWRLFSDIQSVGSYYNDVVMAPGTNLVMDFNCSGDYPWIVETDGDRTYLKSGNDRASASTSSLTATVTVPNETVLSFDYIAKSDATLSDQYFLSVDNGIGLIRATRTNGWERYSLVLSAGTHTLEWRHVKSDSGNPTSDCFAIDNIGIVSADEAYACYTPDRTTLTFYYDKLRYARNGYTFDLNEGDTAPGWKPSDIDNYDNTINVVFTPSFANARPTSTNSWFCDMRSLQSITGLLYLNTSEVTNMSHMFEGCASLSGLNLSSFNTSQVTRMIAMFDGCSGLSSLNLSGFNTSQVTRMDDMFRYCTGLSSLDLSSFNTSNVIDMSGMFDGCSGLRSLDLSSFNTSNVNTMSAMFRDCFRLSSLNVSSFNTSNVNNMTGMFQDCYDLVNLDLRNFNTSNVCFMETMFYRCNNLTTIYVGDSWRTTSVWGSDDMFKYCTSLVGSQGTVYDAHHVDKAYAHIDGGPSNPGYLSETINEAYACYTPLNTTLTFYYDTERSFRSGRTYDLNQDGSYPAWYQDGTKHQVTRVVFSPSFADAWPSVTRSWFHDMPNLHTITGMKEYLHTDSVIDMRYMFCDCSGLSSLDLSGFNTANAVLINHMFYGCSGLTSIDVSNFDTSHATAMDSMFYECTGLTSLDLGNFNTSHVVFMSAMFCGCNNLHTIYARSGWSTAAVVFSYDMFKDCTSLVGGMGTVFDANHTDKAYARIDGGPDNPGYFTDPNSIEAYVCYTPSNTTLTFYYDTERTFRSDTTYDIPEAGNSPGWSNTGATSVVFDPSFAAARPTTTASWFSNMTDLTSIQGMNYLNTSEVTTMQSMFNGCSGLTSLDVSGFNTANVTNMLSVFSGCSGLTSLDVSGFNTANVTNMQSLFNGCSGLTSLDLSSFNTSEVTDMRSMFNGCSGLTSLDLSGFNTANVTNMRSMFTGCSGLTSLDLSGFNTANVLKMDYMFYGCSGMTSLDLSGFNTTKVNNMTMMFYDCGELTTICVGDGWNTGSVTALTSAWMFRNCYKIRGGQGTTYDASHVDKVYAHIDGGPDNPGYFTDKSASQHGDVDGDGNVGIADVTLLIDYVLTGNSTGVNLDVSNVDGDDIIGIADVTAIIDYILTGVW